MKQIPITTFILFFSFLTFSQEKSINAFNLAITNGYVLSPRLIPVTIIDKSTKTEKFYLSNSERLFRATELEYGIKNVDSLESLIKEKNSNQVFEFKRINALNALGFYDTKSIDKIKLNKIDKIIKNKKIINGIETYNLQISLNSKLLKNFDRLRYKLKDSTLTINPNFSKQEIAFLEYLTFETYSPVFSIENLGDRANFDGADKLLKLWKEITIKQWKEISKNIKISENLYNKFIEKYFKKFGSDYYAALFKYGIVLSVSDYNGELGLHGIVK